MSLRIFDPSSGGDTRSWRASACSASSRYFVCSCERLVRAQIEEVRRRPAVAACRTTAQASAEGSRRPACRGTPGSARARAAVARSLRLADLGEQRLEPLGAARPRELRARPRAPARRAARPSAGSSLIRPIPATSACGLPGSTSSAFSPSRSTSRIDGRSARDDRPSRCHVLEQLQRRRELVRHRGRGIRQRQHVRLAQPRRDLRRRKQTGERDARPRSSSCVGERLDARQVRLLRRGRRRSTRACRAAPPPPRSPGPRPSTDTGVPHSRL